MLAHGAAFDVFAHVLCEAWPPELSGDELAGFKITQVTGSFMVMTTGKDGVVEGGVGGYIDMSFVGEDMVVKLPVREAGLECGGDVLQGHLEVLEHERIGLGRVADTFMQFGINEVDKQGVSEKDG